jgi:Uma2 family endonuclease
MEKRVPRLSAAEYLEQESRSAIRHEYLDGETFPMPARSQRHNLIVSNLLLKAQSGGAVRRDGPCQVFGSDMRVRVENRNCFYYPDMSACADPHNRTELYISQPCLVIEVLSSSTAIADRREKRLHYATIPSLLEYIVVDQDRMRVHIFPRDSDDYVVRTLNEPQDAIQMACIDLQVSLREIYRGVDFSAAEDEAPPVVKGSSRSLFLT